MRYPTRLSFMPKVDFSHYEGREQAYVKHCLLDEYLPDWAYKVGEHLGFPGLRRCFCRPMANETS